MIVTRRTLLVPLRGSAPIVSLSGRSALPPTGNLRIRGRHQSGQRWFGEGVPSIDVHMPAGLFSAQSETVLAEELAGVALRAEGLEPTPFLLGKSWVFVHRYQPSSVRTGLGTVAEDAVRIQILAPQGRLGAQARATLIREATEIVVRMTGDPTQAERTFVLIGETAESVWGLAGLTGEALVAWAVERSRSESAGSAGLC
ncbi:4-oxalocrotonate tautomerase family protein [Nocardia sp. NPDC101769]|uniref:tautomerase family protein n=1 Tax=Nocardia sp. NPDC101769 TaxID=3364333 RepID=UPI00380198DF